MDTMPSTLGENLPAVLGVFGALSAAAGWLFNLGSKITANTDALEVISKQVTKNEEGIKEGSRRLDIVRSDYDTKLAAVSGRFELIAAQGSEYRENITKTFARQDQLSAVETRVTTHIDRLVDRLEHISVRLDEISNSLVGAISKLPRQ